jgi:cystathionine beta-lyase
VPPSEDVNGLSDLGTRVTHLGRKGPREKGFINPPVVRGSTVVFPTVKERQQCWSRRFEQEVGGGRGYWHACEGPVFTVFSGVTPSLAACLWHMRHGDTLCP